MMVFCILLSLNNIVDDGYKLVRDGFVMLQCIRDSNGKYRFAMNHNLEARNSRNSLWMDSFQ